jgi:hypothetical protein
MITREFDLMLYQEGNLLFINANQYDSGEQWIFTLYEENGVKYTPATGAIVGVKSDGKGIINTGTVDEYGRVVINETQQMTAAAGLATFELLIDNDTHGTANFKVDVEPRPADNADLSDSDLSLIQEAVDAASEIEDLLGGQDVPTVITPIISDWLDENITNPSNPPIDTSLTVAGAAADAKKTGDEITDLKSAINGNLKQSNLAFSEITLPENLFDYTSDDMCKQGYWYYSTSVGSVVSATSSSSTENYVALKIPVYDSEKVTIGLYPNDLTKLVYWIGAVDADMKLLAYSVVNQNAPVTYNIPEGTVYVLASYSLGRTNFFKYLPKVMAVNADSITRYSEYFEPYYTLENCITTEITDITEKKDIFAPFTGYTENTGEYFAPTGVLPSSRWNWYKMPAQVGDSFVIHTAAGQSARAWYALASDDSVLEYDDYLGTPKVDDWELTIGRSDVSYIVVNLKTNLLAEVSILKKHSDETFVNSERVLIDGEILDEYLSRTFNHEDNILYGKILCCCGDSITYGADLTGDALVTPDIESYQYSAYTKQWTRWTASEPASYGYQIASRNNMIFYNGGVSGACVQGSGGSSEVPGFSEADGEYTLLPENIDYLTLFYGWNDTAYGSLGTINDSTNNSYYGAYNVVLPYLINKYPYTKIALIVPFGTDVGHRQAIRNLADKWGLACFDMMQGGTPLYYNKEPDVDVDPAIVTSNRAKYQANGAHPNFRGHYQIGTMLEAFLRGI